MDMLLPSIYSLVEVLYNCKCLTPVCCCLGLYIMYMILHLLMPYFCFWYRSWNYNYIGASVALTGSPDTFCEDPDIVAREGKYVWGVGIFFWM